MLSESASRLSIPLLFLDPDPASSAKQLSNPSLLNPSPGPHPTGSFSDPEQIRSLAERVDVLTVEIEHVDVGILKEVVKAAGVGRNGKGVKVYPSPEVVEIIQDKYRQKVWLKERGIPVADFVPIEPSSSSSASIEDLSKSVESAISQFGTPIMLKSRTLAYDGRGNYLLTSSSPSSVAEALKSLGSGSRPLYAERLCPFIAEVAVMVVRSTDGKVRSYPAVETVHKESICHIVRLPLRKGGPGVAEKAKELAERAVKVLGDGAVGIFGVEMFLVEDGRSLPFSGRGCLFSFAVWLIVPLGAGTLLVNEIAPRPHNSGHLTIESSQTSQFENHLRAILSLPLGSTASKVSSSAMLNILGSADGEAGVREAKEVIRRSLEVDGATVHWYGKNGCRKGRKMGHITIVGNSDAEVEDGLRTIMNGRTANPAAASAQDEGSAIQAVKSVLPSSLVQQPSPPTTKPGFSHPHPLVSVIMGSISDLPTMQAASTMLTKFSVPHELTIVSAHRTPLRMVKFARDAESRGVRVIIAGAGGAAHLPGMVASLTSLPVVGVPVRGSTMEGVDSLYSIVQMPVSLIRVQALSSFRSLLMLCLLHAMTTIISEEYP